MVLALGRQKQENDCEFVANLGYNRESQASLVYVKSLSFKNNKSKYSTATF